MSALRILAAAPLLIAAAPDAPLSTGMLVTLALAIAGVVILRGLFLRRFTRRRSRGGDGYSGDGGTHSSDDRHGDHGPDGGDSGGGGDGGGGGD